jgi:exosortase
MRRTAVPGKLWLAIALLIPSLVTFIFGHAYDFDTLDAAGLFGVGVSILYLRFGAAVTVCEWFPLLYLAFAVPPPHAALLAVTAPLKQLVSQAATGWLAVFGVPVARQGVTIFVAQYQLLVEDACSGMNSIVGLTAVSLLYIYLVRGSSWLYALVLSLCVIPIAVVANIMRIMVLILLTYFFGNEVAQGFLHFFAGIFLFSTAILIVFLIDKGVAPVFSRWGKSRVAT